MPIRVPPPVMLLAAGLGTRLRPLTETVPKPLVRVAGRTLLERAVDNAAAEGVTRIVVNAHHLAHQVEAEVRRIHSLRPELSLAISDERGKLLDSGGGVKRALPLLDGDPLLVMNADSFWTGTDRPLARMATLRASVGGDVVVLLCVQPARAIGFRRSHDFCLAPDGRITRDRGQPVIYGGIALLPRAVFEDTPDGRFSLNLIFEAALAAERLFGVVLDAPWFHVGDASALAEAEAALASVPA